MDLVELGYFVEEEFGLPHEAIPWTELATNHITRIGWMVPHDVGDATIGELCDAINKKLAELELPVPEDTYKRVQRILVEEFGVRAKDAHPKALLVKDLGLD